MDEVYLDNAATTYPKPDRVYEKMDFLNRNLAVNAGRGVYKKAEKATNLIDETKKRLLDLVGADNSVKVAFTPSITVAINQVLQGLNWDEIKTVYVSSYEHNSVMRTLNLIKKRSDFEIIELAMSEENLEIDLDKIDYQFSIKKPDLVFVNAMSNVTGYILPFKEIFKMAKSYRAIKLLDTAQFLGMGKINWLKDNINFLFFAGHKSLYGPFGVGGIITNGEVEVENILAGGNGSDSLNLNMPEKFPGVIELASPNLIAIGGLNESLKISKYDECFQKEKNLTEYLINKLKDIEGIVLYLPNNLKSHNSIVSLNLEGYKSDELGQILDQDFNIAVRTGYHCAPLIHKYLKDKKYNGTMRVSLGIFNTKKDIDRLTIALKKLSEE